MVVSLDFVIHPICVLGLAFCIYILGLKHQQVIHCLKHHPDFWKEIILKNEKCAVKLVSILHWNIPGAVGIFRWKGEWINFMLSQMLLSFKTISDYESVWKNIDNKSEDGYNIIETSDMNVPQVWAEFAWISLYQTNHGLNFP